MFPGGTTVDGITNLEECKALCANDTRCVAVNWYQSTPGEATICQYVEVPVLWGGDSNTGLFRWSFHKPMTRFCPHG